MAIGQPFARTRDTLKSSGSSNGKLSEMKMKAGIT
jgi:hypothetical protein